MNENTDSRKLETGLIFTLEVRIPEQPTKRLQVLDRLLAGLDPRNDLILIDPVIKTKHLLFRKRNNILSVHYLGNDGEGFLNGHKLEKGKLYILEKGDLLKMGAVEILIHREIGPIQIINEEKNDPLTDESFKEMPVPKKGESKKEAQKSTEVEETEKSHFVIPNQLPKIKIVAHKREPIFNFTTIRLIPYKFYGFLFDIAFTYFVLSFAIPSLGLMQECIEILYPINQLINDFILVYYPPYSQLNIHSVVEFFVCFHALMVSTSLILGTTPGAFVIGLHSKPGRSSFLGKRFKAYLYAILNIAALPLLIFDFPFFRGRTIKELLTFSEREISTSGFFKITQRIIVPAFLFISLISPLFLPSPYMDTITEIKNKTTKLKEVHVTTITSQTQTMGISLNAELNNQYRLLPSFKPKKWGMTFYDLTNNKALVVQEDNRIDPKKAFFQLYYANPLASLHDTLSLPLHNAKRLQKETIASLNFSLEKIPDFFQNFGPFMANGLLFKNLFLQHFSSQNNFYFLSFDKQNPAIKISNDREERLVLFTQKQIIEFSLQIPKNSNLLNIFINSIISTLQFTSSAENQAPSAPQILEVLESFEEGKSETILTYYINEVKKAQELNNPEWSAFLKKNILQTKMALEGIERRKTQKAFEELIKSLN